MTGDDPEDRSGADDERDAATKAADAAVRRALVESRRQLLSFLQRRLGSSEAAEDVLQAFMLRAIERSTQLRDVRTVRGWLSRILASTIVDHQRRLARRRQWEAVMSPNDIEALEIEADDELDEAVCNCLYKLLPTLKPEYAEVIWRVDLLGEPRIPPATKCAMWNGAMFSPVAGNCFWQRTSITGSSLPVYLPAMLWSREVATAAA